MLNGLLYYLGELFMDLTEFTNTLQNWIATTGIKIVIALLIWFISF